MFVEVNNQLYELAWFQWVSLLYFLEANTTTLDDLEGLILSQDCPLYIEVVLKAPLHYVRAGFKFTVGE